MKLIRTLFTIGSLVVSGYIHAQDYSPFVNSNYSGVTGIVLQPASIADSRLKFDMQLFGTSINMQNSYWGMNASGIMQSWKDALRNSLPDENSDFEITRNDNGKDKSAILTTRMDFFNVMVTLSPKDAFALSVSQRNIINIDNVSEPLAQLADAGFKDQSLWYMQLSNTNFSFQTNSWMDFGLTYARVILPEGKHFLKAGGTLKVTQGILSSYLFIRDLNYQFNTNDTLSLFKSRVSYGTSNNFNFDENDLEGSLTSFRIDTKSALSFDLGVVYEYRPDYQRYQYDAGDQKGIWRRDMNKYLLRLGISITDLGRIKYERNPASRDFNADISGWYVGDMGFEGIHGLNDTIGNYFNYYDVPSTYNMNLPLAMSLQADVKLARWVYFNFTPYLALMQGSKDENKVHYLSSINFSPRFDSPLLGISLPFQYNNLGQFNAGFGLRLGPVWIGSASALTTLFRNASIRGTDVSVAARIPILYSRPRQAKKAQVTDQNE